MVYKNVSKKVQRKTKQEEPEVPENLESLGDFLYTYDLYKSIYQGMVQTDDDEAALIFSNDKLLGELKKATEVYLHRSYLVNTLI